MKYVIVCDSVENGYPRTHFVEIAIVDNARVPIWVASIDYATTYSSLNEAIACKNDVCSLFQNPEYIKYVRVVEVDGDTLEDAYDRAMRGI